MANNQLLDQVLGVIKANPHQWHQDQWRCQSGFCFAGWAAELSQDVKWESPYDSFGSSGSIVIPTTSIEEFRKKYPQIDDSDFWDDDGSIHVRYFAAAALELTDEQHHNLFRGTNTLSNLEAMVKELHNNPQSPLWDTETQYVSDDGVVCWRTNDLPVSEFPEYDEYEYEDGERDF